jgi:NTP pyrophosphatase (non-canonical NTP hydrolase)
MEAAVSNDPRTKAEGAWDEWADEDRATERDAFKELRMTPTIKSLQEWANDFHQVAVSKGFWDAYPTREARIRIIPEKLCLIHSEVSEALEDYRTDKDPSERTYEGAKLCGFGSEIADVVIRAMELAAALDIDIGAIIEEKHEFNKTRSRMNGGKKC